MLRPVEELHVNAWLTIQKLITVENNDATDVFFTVVHDNDWFFQLLNQQYKPIYCDPKQLLHQKHESLFLLLFNYLYKNKFLHDPMLKRSKVLFILLHAVSLFGF